MHDLAVLITEVTVHELLVDSRMPLCQSGHVSMMNWHPPSIMSVKEQKSASCSDLINIITQSCSFRMLNTGRGHKGEFYFQMGVAYIGTIMHRYTETIRDHERPAETSRY
jgi:hypothetical protein